MKTSAYVRLVAVAAIAMAPFAAHSDESQLMQSCVDAFVAQSLAGQQVTVRVDNDYRSPAPLVLRNLAPRIKLVASEKTSARVIATATCSAKSGIVTVEPAKANLTAAL